MYQLKAKDSEIKSYPLCLGNISKDFAVNSMIKAILSGYVYDFSIDFDAIRYLMKKPNIK